MSSYVPLKQLNKKQRKFQQKPWVTKEIILQLKRKIGSLKSTLNVNVMIVTKIFYINNKKHIETAYQL